MVVRFALAVALLAVGAHADPVLEWNEGFIRCVQKEMPSPCLTARNLALLHLAMHLAITAAETSGSPEIAHRRRGCRGG